MKNMLPIVRIFKDLHIPTNLKQAKTSLKEISGIYCLRHISSGKVYIGQAIDLSLRIIDHINGRHSNILLQRALNKYGLAEFEFIIVEFVENTLLLTPREQVHLDWLFSLPSEFRYNILSTAGSSLGYVHTDESKALMSQRQSGENHPMYGKTHSVESKVLISERKLGNTNAPRVPIFVYGIDNTLVKELSSQVAAAEFLKVSRWTVQNYLASGKVLKEKYILRSSGSFS